MNNGIGKENSVQAESMFIFIKHGKAYNNSKLFCYIVVIQTLTSDFPLHIFYDFL